MFDINQKLSSDSKEYDVGSSNVRIVNNIGIYVLYIECILDINWLFLLIYKHKIEPEVDEKGDNSSILNSLPLVSGFVVNFISNCHFFVIYIYSI
jgi:hypothetical protein